MNGNVKTLTEHINWLDEIDGLTVAQAIEYLRTLDQSKTLNYHMEGDTHGCELVSNLKYDVLMSNAEILESLEKHYAREIKHYETAKQTHLKDGRLQRVESCEIQLTRLRNKLDEARIKYGQ